MSSNWHEIKTVLDAALASPSERRDDIVHAMTGGKVLLREQVYRLLNDNDQSATSIRRGAATCPSNCTS